MNQTTTYLILSNQQQAQQQLNNVMLVNSSEPLEATSKDLSKPTICLILAFCIVMALVVFIALHED